MEQFATQASIEHPIGLEHQVFNSKDSGFLKDNLLDLLDLDQLQKKETLSPTHNVQTLRSELNALSSLMEKRKQVLTSGENNREIRSSSLIELHDKSSESSSEAESSEASREDIYQKKEEYVKNCEVSVNNCNHFPIRKHSDQGENLFQGLLKIPDQYIRISRHQKALLENQDSWLQSEADICKFARIPTKVSKQLISFLSHKKNPQGSITNDPYNHQALKSYDQFHQWDYLSKGHQRIPIKYFHIPNDQKALLDDPSSWFLGESDPSNRYARIPLEISQSFISYLNSDIKPEESSQKIEEECINKIPELFDNGQESNHLADNNYREISSLADTKIDRDSISEFLVVNKCQKNQSIDENISLEISSNTHERQGYEPEKDRNFVDLDQENLNEDPNAQSMSFKPNEVIECDDNYSLTPEPLSRAASLHDSVSDDLRTQDSDNSQSPISHHTQAEIHKSDTNTEDFPKENFYTNFKSIYPEYLGSLRDFTWALVYIEWLVPQDENLDWEYWDDFVRVLASEYTNNIRYCGDPITGLAYYKIKPRRVLFSQNLLSPQTLQVAISSLNKDEVEYFRHAFGNEPKEPARNSYSAQSIQLNDPKKDLSQKLFGEGRENLTKPIKFIDESRLKGYNHEFDNEKSPVNTSYERSDNSFQKAHLRSWRQFLRKRKLAGTLSTFEVDEVFRKRYCTIRRNQHSDPIL